MKEIVEHIDVLKRKLSVSKENSFTVSKLNTLKAIALFLSEAESVSGVEEIIRLNDAKSGYSEFRLMNDCESDDRNLWIEYKHDDGVLKLNAGDFVIKMK